MGQKKHQQPSSTETAKATPFLESNTAVDPLLASLFESSSGPVKAPEIRYESYQASRDRAAELKSKDDEELEDISGEEDEVEDEDMEDASEQDEDNAATTKSAKGKDTAGRKRKRGGLDDDLEETYMRRLAKEEVKEEEKRLAEKEGKRRKVVDDEEDGEPSSSPEDDEDAIEEGDDDDINSPPPLHESMSGSAESAALDKSNRTVFLGNVSTEAIKSKSAKKTLIAHLSSFFKSLPESGTAHTVESVRFRSTAFASTAVPKRASFAKKELMDKTTRSTNAYAVYSTAAAARRAPTALNGSIVLDRHLRVDSVAHPLAVDNKRCVFVGNLGFVDEETKEDDDDEKKQKKKTPPSDVEEGLWRVFNAHTGAPSSSKGKPSKTGNVESVRVVRDPTTRIGKGFAYVQFHNENHVEAALHLDGKRYPPLLPRKLRVVRAKRVGKKRDMTGPSPQGAAAANGKKKDHQGTLQGRASRLLGRAGAAKLRNSTNGAATGANSTPAGVRVRGADTAAAPAPPLVFEGYRATADTPKFKVKTKSRGAAVGGKKGKGKPKTRSSRRGAAFKAQGGKKKVG